MAEIGSVTVAVKVEPAEEFDEWRTCGDCEEFRMCCGCGAGWCMKLLEPTHRDDFACAPRMEGCSI